MPAVAQQNRSLRSLLIGDAVATAGFVLISSVFEEVSIKGHTVYTVYAAVLHFDVQLPGTMPPA